MAFELTDAHVDQYNSDGYTVFRSCTDALGGDVDLDAFAAYLAAHPNLGPPPLDRIHKDA